MKIKKFECIVDDGKNVFKTFIPAVSKIDLKRNWDGNGEFIQIKEVPEYLPFSERVVTDLRTMGYGDAECQLMGRLLSTYLDGTI